MHGSGSKPYLNLVNNSSNGSPSNRGFNQSEGLFSTSVADKNISNSIDGATALKLDEGMKLKIMRNKTLLLIILKKMRKIKLRKHH